MKTKERKTQWY